MLRLLSFTVQNYGSLKHVTRLKVAPNMADQTSMKHPISSLKCSKNKSYVHWDIIANKPDRRYDL